MLLPCILLLPMYSNPPLEHGSFVHFLEILSESNLSSKDWDFKDVQNDYNGTRKINKAKKGEISVEECICM